jgi:hypothetical protein
LPKKIEVCSGFAKKIGWPQDLIDSVQNLFAEALSWALVAGKGRSANARSH